MANPRIDDLRRKLEREPGSRLFAQLAEELRKDGDLAEAIRVARQGLAQHPNYPSARMTLGRALLDSGDAAAARTEFETVLNGAPDNILASRFLAECLEGLGEKELALHRYRATLGLMPGDKHLLAKVAELEKASAAAPPAPGDVVEPEAAEPRAPEPEPPPIRVVEVDEPMEVVSRFEPPPPPPPVPAEEIFFDEPDAGPSHAVAADTDEAPVPLVPVDEEEFELERPYEVPPVQVAPVAVPEPGAAPTIEAEEPLLEADPIEPIPQPIEAEPLLAEPLADVPPAPPVEPEPMMLEPDVIDEEFDLEPAPPPGPPRVTFREEVLKETALFEDVPAPGPFESAPAREAAPEVPVQSPEPELASPTLAELYFEQGVPEKAVEVYRRLLERDPGNDRLRARLGEIEAAGSRPAPVAAASPATPQGAIGRAIARLEDLRSALARKD